MIENILAQIDNEISRLQQVRSPLTRDPVKPPTAKAKLSRRPLSAAARKRIADAQKARWAKLKGTKKG